MYEWLKFGHVVGAIIWVGAGIAFSFVTLRLADADLPTKKAFAHAAEKVGPLFPLAALLVLGLGIWMVLDTPAIGFGDTWILIGFGGILLSGVVQGLRAPSGKRLNQELEAGDPAAHTTWRSMARLNWVDVALLLIVVWAMVTKPGL